MRLSCFTGQTFLSKSFANCPKQAETRRIYQKPLAQSMRLQGRTLVLIPCLISCHRCEKSASLTSWSQNEATSTRESTTCASTRAEICCQDGVTCLKNGKIVPYHTDRWARIPKLAVSVLDYGSCFFLPKVYINDYITHHRGKICVRN